jgi:rhamnogalacturonan endolyase
MSTHTANLDRLAATGLPIHVTELDIDGPTDAVQLADYQRIFPVFWEHPAVRGITLWGYRPGHWRTAQGAYIVLENGAERPAMVWLQEYVAATDLAAWVRLGGLNQVYDGTPRAVTVTTIPEGLPVAVTYNGSTTPPTAPGSYAVVATVTGEDAFGSAEGTLVISASAVSRHAPRIAGTLAGSAQMLLPENVSLAGGVVVSGDLLVPGSPQVLLNGSPSYGGTVEGSGDPAPSGYAVTLSGAAALRHVVRATDPVEMPSVPTPTPPSGTRDVVLRSPGESPGAFSTLRDLSLRENVGQVVVPPGSYGTFSATSGSGFTLGSPAAGVPAVYNLQGLTLKEGSRLEIRGPVILNVGSGVTIQGEAGNSGKPEWLTLRISSGGITVDGVVLDAYVIAPGGIATVNTGGTVRGGVAADRIVIRSGGGLITP